MEQQMVTISVKIPKELKEKMKSSHIKVSKFIRDLLEERMVDEEVRRLREDIKKHRKSLDKISVEHVVEDLREDRYKVH